MNCGVMIDATLSIVRSANVSGITQCWEVNFRVKSALILTYSCPAASGFGSSQPSKRVKFSVVRAIWEYGCHTDYGDSGRRVAMYWPRQYGTIWRCHLARKTAE